MRVNKPVGYYDLLGFNHVTAAYDQWLGTATVAVAMNLKNVRLGRFIGYSAPTKSGWGKSALAAK
jgi:hypothetical protein